MSSLNFAINARLREDAEALPYNNVLLFPRKMLQDNGSVVV